MKKRVLSVLVTLLVLCSVACFTFSEGAISANRTITITNKDIVLPNDDQSDSVIPTLTVYVGKPATLKATVEKLSDDAPKSTKLTWSSDCPEIAKVSSSGQVTGVGPGAATITCCAADDESICSKLSVTVIVPVKKITADTTKMTLVLGADESASIGQINVSFAPENATEQGLSFISSDENIVTVDETGKVTAHNEGKAVITITAADTTCKTSAKCNIVVGQAVSSIKMDTAATIEKGRTLNLKPQVEPSNALNKKVTFTSSNNSIATVSAGGAISAKGCGTADIICTAADGSGVESVCKITVVQKAKKIELTSDKKLKLFVGSNSTMRVKVTPVDTTDKSVQYSSDDSYVASVDSSGKITAKHAGKTVIRATTKDGSKKSCSVNIVVEPALPITVESLGFGVFNYNLLGITVKNLCSSTNIVNFDFELTFVDYAGRTINSGSFNLGKNASIPAGSTKTIKRTVYGTGQSYKTIITITGVDFSDGSHYTIPSSLQETWSFTR